MKTARLFLSLSAMSLLAVGCSTTGDDVNGYVENYYSYMTNGLDGEMTGVPEAGGDKFEEFADNPFVKTSIEPTRCISRWGTTWPT